MCKVVTLVFKIPAESAEDLDAQDILEEILDEAQAQGRSQFRMEYGHSPVREKTQFRLSHERDSISFYASIAEPYILTSTRFLPKEVVSMMDEEDLEAVIATELNRLSKDFEAQYSNCKADPDTVDVRITQRPDIHAVALDFFVAEKVFDDE